jgi:mRNA-degrading endonuclease RelE of RelBE toxin-antitoxin system
MSIRIIATDNFKREAKRLLKKHISLKDDLVRLEEELLANPRSGTQIRENVYKVRLAVKSKGKGKSGGVRVITCVLEIPISDAQEHSDANIYLLSIYDKSDEENISERDLQDLIANIQTLLDSEDTDNQE